MKQTIVPVTIPYTVEFIRRRCRTVESLVVWDQRSVAISEVNDHEASIAYCIGSRGSSGPAYDIGPIKTQSGW